MKDFSRSLKLLEAARRDRGQPEYTMLANGQQIQCKNASERHWYDEFTEALQKKQLRPQEVSFRKLFEQVTPDGREVVDSWRPSSGGGGINLQEAGVNTAAFSAISGQIVFSTVLEAFQNPLFISDLVCPAVQSEFESEKIPGVSGVGDVMEGIGEGMPYPTAGLTGSYVETPATTKRGTIVPVTKEALFFDRTGLILQRAASVGEYLAINKEKRVLDTVLGITTSYKRNGGTAQATYANSHTDGDFDNLLASNALVDWTDIDAVQQNLAAVTDPDTAEPVAVLATQLVVPLALQGTAYRILNATEIRHSAGGVETLSSNPLRPGYQLITNQYVKARTSSDSTWFFGDFRRAFAYMQNWGITSVSMPAGSHLEFTQDVVQAYKVSERGTPAVREPRYVQKCTA